MLQGIKEKDMSIENELIRRDIGHTKEGDKDYPQRLKCLSDRPKELYYIGKLPADDIPSVAIIGARNCSGYGRQMAREFAIELAAAGIQIISGMARGVDGIAGRAALMAGGSSYAVLGSGVDVCYPRENAELYEELMSKGGVISELAPGYPAMAANFPRRNRIISGLADAVLVIEARERSGTLITVNMALEQGREVYALPGRITDSLSYGCNRLISEGAVPAIRPYELTEQIISRFGNKGIKTAKENGQDKDNMRYPNADHDKSFMTVNEREVLGVLDYRPKTASEIFYELSTRVDIRIEELLCLLTDMTVKHMIECIDGANYCLMG